MEVAVRLANEHRAELLLVHAWYLPPTALGGEYVHSAAFVQDLSGRARRDLDAAAAAASKQGARHVSSTLLAGIPWQQIVDTAHDDSACDLIVIGTHGRSGLARMLLGSVAEMVVRHAPCSVLAIHPGAVDTRFRHVLCSVDFSRSSRAAMDLGAAMLQPGSTGVTLLHVLDLPVRNAGKLHTPEAYRDLDAHVSTLLDRWTADLAAKVSVPVDQRMRIGHPGAQVLAAIDDDRTIDLVAMGDHGRTGIARMLLGPVTEKVVRRASCSVLVARGRSTVRARAPSGATGDWLS